MKIRVLSDDMINKIAAGEVVENPASVVKELVENSLDAGATEVIVEIKGGGRHLIRVSDNGCGMSRDDALLSIERHATSKLREFADFDQLSTMGFRGEALPSIASISKMTLITSGEIAKQGTLLLLEGGKILKCGDAVRDQGTTIEVQSLFFNVPVRKKFQRSPKYDTGEIVKTLSSIGMAYPSVQFRLVGDGKTLLNLRSAGENSGSSGVRLRAQEVLGEHFVYETVRVQSEREAFSLFGLVGLPTAHKANRSGQHLFVNGRTVVSKLVSEAMREGYGTSLPSNRYPVFLLHLRLSGDWVDVNVHPQKREVRFRQEQSLKEALSEAVAEAVRQGSEAPFEGVSIENPICTVADPSFVSRCKEEVPVYSPAIRPPAAPAPTPIAAEAHMRELPPINGVRQVLATIPGYILLSESGGGLRIVDQNRARHRVFYEQLLSREHEKQTVAVQALLVPYVFQTSEPNAIILREYLRLFNVTGIGVREFGPRAFAVDSVPDYLEKENIQEVIEEMVEEMRRTDRASDAAAARLAASASSIASRFGKRMELVAAEALIRQLASCGNPRTCPMGKPVFTTLNPDKIQKLFLGSS